VLFTLLQVLRDNTIVDSSSIEFTSISSGSAALTPSSKAVVRQLWKRVAMPPAFPAWSTLGCPTPNGTLANPVRFDRAGLVRSATNDLPGAQL
jgi:hypothetical protein